MDTAPASVVAKSNIIICRARTPEGAESVLLVGRETFCWSRGPGATDWQTISELQYQEFLAANTVIERAKVQ